MLAILFKDMIFSNSFVMFIKLLWVVGTSAELRSKLGGLLIYTVPM